ncbi:thioesterase family protein [Dactylosporangium salmoneum]|uniref:Fluoroacetyl-CoA-specific thioesterase-like domain-containing protein n=1 Tax=Dactylosporangium salmoneum TaxID=53361 RepID=A0ABP5V4S3_9ACTN
MDDIWQAPIGVPLDLPVATALPPVPLPPDAHVDQLIWHGDGIGPDARVYVAARDAHTVTVRIAAGERVVADLRVRRGPARAPQPHGLLGPGVTRRPTYTRRFTVGEKHTTDHVPGAEPVLSTPTLIAFMEDTAADVLRPHFGPATASLGTWIGVRHTGPARIGQTVIVTAALVETRGRRYLFDVRAAADGRPVGDGQVAQTLISLE